MLLSPAERASELLVVVAYLMALPASALPGAVFMSTRFLERPGLLADLTHVPRERMLVGTEGLVGPRF